MQLAFTTNFKDAEVALQRIEAGLPIKQRELLDTLTPRFVAIQQTALRHETPQNTRAAGWLPDGADTRELAETTTSDILRQGSNQFESRALIQTYQTKLVRNSKGKTFELSDVLVKGRDTLDKTPIRPAIKSALSSPALASWAETVGATNLPPYASVKGSVAPPDDYFQRARDAALPEIEVAAAQGVASMSESMFTLR